MHTYHGDGAVNLLRNDNGSLRMKLHGFCKVEVSLEIQPKLGRGAEALCQAQGRICRDGSLTMHNSGDAIGWDAKHGRQLRHAQVVGADELFQENFAGGDIVDHGGTSVIVYDFNIKSVAFSKLKANPKLVIHSNAVLAFAVAGQGLKVIGRGNAKVAQLHRRIQHPQLAKSYPFKGAEFATGLAMKNHFGLLATERSDHGSNNIFLRFMSSVKISTEEKGKGVKGKGVRNLFIDQMSVLVGSIHAPSPSNQPWR